ncbi:hypothetical protein WB388_14925 [Streptomyces brasiliscabiei]|uniref:Uncharacterized protein n=1 Tax=Streptomyces brasiliscabiei TaxID=2736302 RepID=A0ABU8GQZ1_9ACTN
MRSGHVGDEDRRGNVHQPGPGPGRDPQPQPHEFTGRPVLVTECEVRERRVPRPAMMQLL